MYLQFFLSTKQDYSLINNHLVLNMDINTVIFDMDGLLIDSEPLWNEAALEVFNKLGESLDKNQFSNTTGLRTREFVQWWFDHFKLDPAWQVNTELEIIAKVTSKVISGGKPMPGVSHILNFFIQRNFKIGLASSSPMSLINATVDYLGLRPYLNAISSAEELDYGKPHPQVYLNCAKILNVNPVNCIAFEDSFNGMIAAKAARMKCIVVPASSAFTDKRWNAADMKISSLHNFNELLLQTL